VGASGMSHPLQVYSCFTVARMAKADILLWQMRSYFLGLSCLSLTLLCCTQHHRGIAPSMQSSVLLCCMHIFLRSDH
jgi:uncharacterized membrane protein YdcZ (DUF606 family)